MFRGLTSKIAVCKRSLQLAVESFSGGAAIIPAVADNNGHFVLVLFTVQYV